MIEGSRNGAERPILLIGGKERMKKSDFSLLCVVVGVVIGALTGCQMSGSPSTTPCPPTPTIYAAGYYNNGAGCYWKGAT